MHMQVEPDSTYFVIFMSAHVSSLSQRPALTMPGVGVMMSPGENLLFDTFEHLYVNPSHDSVQQNQCLKFVINVQTQRYVSR